MSIFDKLLEYINNCKDLPSKAEANGFFKDSSVAVFFDGDKQSFNEDIDGGGLLSLPFRILIRIKPKNNNERMNIYQIFNNIMLYLIDNSDDEIFNNSILPRGSVVLSNRHNDGTEEYSQSFNLFYYK